MFRCIGRLPVFVIVSSAPLCVVTCALLFLLIPAAAVGAPSGSPLSFDEAVRIALADEPRIAELVDQARADEARAVAAGALPEPALRIGLNNYPIESGGFSTEGMTSASLGLRQAFPPGASRRHQRELFDRRAAATRESAESRRRTVAAATKRAWLDVFYWQRVGAQLAAARPYFTELVAVTESRYSVGRRLQQDVLRAELELSRLDDRLLDAETELALKRAELASWVGSAGSRPLASRLPVQSEVPAVEVLLAALPEHPVLRGAAAEVAAGDAAVALAEQRRKPRWALDVAYAHRDGRLQTGDPRSDFLTVGVTFDLPFARRRSIDSELTAALSERSAAAATRRGLLRDLETELLAEHARYEQLGRRLDLYRQRLLGQADAGAAASLDAYRSDTVDFETVMRAYIDALEVKTDYIELGVARAQSHAALAWLGGL